MSSAPSPSAGRSRAASLDGLARSAGTAGFADSLLQALSELESGLVDPEHLDGDLQGLYAAYRARARPGRAVGSRCASAGGRPSGSRADLDAWHGEPVFAYGFEDLTGAEWSLLEALSGRAEVHVSLPYEPGREVFASLRRTADDLSGLADGRIEELVARSHEYAHPALAHLERALFEETPPGGPALDGAVWFLEGAGRRGTLELVGEEVLALLRQRHRTGRDRASSPRRPRRGAPRSRRSSAASASPYALEHRTRLGATPFGHALLELLRYAWLDAGRRELFAFLRSPYSGSGVPPSTSSRAGCAGGRSRGRSASRRRPRSFARRLARRSPSCAAGDAPVAAVRRSCGR